MRIRVLIIDDRQGLLDLDVDESIRAGFELLTASNTDEALALLEAHEPQVIIVDRDLPDADGFAFARRVRGLNDATRILLATPDDSDAERKAARSAGADGIIVKPIRSQAFRQSVLEAAHINTRTHPRVDAELEVDYTSGDEVFLEKCLNLSMGGMFLRTRQPLPIGADVQLRFHLPGVSERIDVRGSVAWVQYFQPDGPADQNPGMGVSFHDLDESDARTLKAFVLERLKELGIGD